MRIPGTKETKKVKPTVTKNAIVGIDLSEYATPESAILNSTIMKVALP